MRALLVLVTLLAMVGAPEVALVEGAQTAPSVQVTNVDSGGWPRVVATVTVLDSSGRPVTGLGAEAFSGDIGGQPLGVTSATPASDDNVGIAVVATFDTSGSMEGDPLAEAKTAAKGLVGQIRPGDQGAIISFANSVNVVQGFTGDPNSLNAAIDSLVAVGDTALYAGVRDSINFADTAPLSRRSIILLSDGVDSGGVSGVSAEETLALADQSDAIIFTIGLGPTIDEAYLTQLAARGRGQYLRAPTPEQLTSVYQSVGSILRNQYVVEFDAAGVDQEAATGQPLTVSVNVGGVTSSAQAAVSVPVVATPVATPVATEGTATGGEEESSGGFPVLIAVAAVVGALALVGGALLLLRRRRWSGTTRAIEMDVKRFRQKDAAPVTAEIARAVEPEEAMAWLVLPDGIKKPLGMTPVTIGYSADCTVKLDGGNAPSMERVRVWWRDGNFMLHNLSRAGRVSIGGKPVTWVVLEDGDEVEIGSQMVRFVETGSGGEDGNGQT